jgi:hypothetical protein
VPKVVLERLESVVENIVEGAFGLILRGKIQPLEIARRLTREAEEQKIITLNRVFVPNQFFVGLHPADMATLEPIQTEVQAEFQRFVGEWVIDRDYTVTGPIKVALRREERVRRGQMRIESALDDAQVAELTAQKGLGLQVKVTPPQETVGCLTVEEGPDAQRAFTLSGRKLMVGTATDCDIRLRDPSIPGHYAWIEPAAGTWRISELNGGPAAHINDFEEHDGLLREGDAVRMGGNLFRFHIADARERVLADAA